MPERDTFEHKIGQQLEHQKPVEAVKQEAEEIELSPEDLVEVTTEEMETEAESVVEKSKEEIGRLDKESGLGEPELTEAKKETGVEEETKSFGQKVGEVLKLAKEKIYGLFKPSFDPEAELARIKKLPHDERKQAVGEFKEKLAEQKSGLAKLQSSIMAEIFTNPDMPKEQMINMIKRRGVKIGISDEQMKIAENLVDNYQDEHQRVKELREQYPKDEELFKQLYGKYPEGKVVIESRPATFLIKVYDINDYAYLMGATENQSPIENVSNEYKTMAMNTSGINLRWNTDPFLKSTIVIKMPLKRAYEEILNHEEQHALNALFNEAKIFSNAKQELLNSRSDIERETALHRYFVSKRRAQGEKLAKDEIMAYYTGNADFKPDKIIKKLLRPNGLYDYFKDAKVSLTKHLTKDLVPKIGEEKFQEMVQRIFQEVFVDEYKKVVTDGVQAFYDLHKKGNLEIKNAVSMLSHEPLYKWPIAVKRILELKK